jgi:2-methylisocitrate lyase-like PEP mutase family enzyme
LKAEELEELGYKIVIFSTAALRVVHKAVADLMEELKRKGTQIDCLNRMKTRQETYELLGYPEFTQLENRYMPPER